jgi:hypothetical protein
VPDWLALILLSIAWAPVLVLLLWLAGLFGAAIRLQRSDTRG